MPNNEIDPTVKYCSRCDRKLALPYWATGVPEVCVDCLEDSVSDSAYRIERSLAQVDRLIRERNERLSEDRYRGPRSVPRVLTGVLARLRTRYAFHRFVGGFKLRVWMPGTDVGVDLVVDRNVKRVDATIVYGEV